MHEVLIARCHCGHEPQLPSSSTLRRVPHPKLSTKDALYLDFACPECGLTIRYMWSSLDLRMVDVETLYSAHLDKSWIGVHVQCDHEGCHTHAVVETAWDNAKTKDQLRTIVAGWRLCEITCYDGHPAKHPTTRIWDSVPLGRASQAKI